MSDGPRLFSLNYFEFFRISHYVDLYTCNVSLVGSPRRQLLDTPIKEHYIYKITILVRESLVSTSVDFAK